MLNYTEAMKRFKAEYFLNVLIEADGNICVASALTGVHRNTIMRVLHRQGHTAHTIRKYVRQQKLAAKRRA